MSCSDILARHKRAVAQYLRRDWAHPTHICAGTGFTRTHICAGTGLTPPTSAPGLGSFRGPSCSLVAAAAVRVEASMLEPRLQEDQRDLRRCRTGAPRPNVRRTPNGARQTTAAGGRHAPMRAGHGAPTPSNPVPAPMWQGVSPLKVQMRQRWAQSRCRCGSGERAAYGSDDRLPPRHDGVVKDDELPREPLEGLRRAARRLHMLSKYKEAP
jgi:hypothetical protein